MQLAAPFEISDQLYNDAEMQLVFSRTAKSIEYAQVYTLSRWSYYNIIVIDRQCDMIAWTMVLRFEATLYFRLKSSF